MTVPVEPDAEKLAEIALDQPGVAGLHRGRFGEVATYLPGRRVPGVRVTDSAVEIHIVVRPNRPVLETAADLRAALQPHLSNRPLGIVIADLADDRVDDAEDPLIVAENPPPQTGA